MENPNDIMRCIGNLIRLGTVASIDADNARVRVQSGDLLTASLPWQAARAGTTCTWSAPSIGEQVLLLCPGGDTVGAVAITGIYSDSLPAPSTDPDMHLMQFVDGALISYNAKTHALTVALPAGGTASISADGGITLTGDVSISGALKVSGQADVQGDVVGAGISLAKHTHGGIQPGGGNTGQPQ